MIELNTIESRKRIIAEAGGNYLDEKEGLIWFTDPVTGSTLVCKPEEVTVEFVREHMRLSREKFNHTKTSMSDADIFAEIYFSVRVAFCREQIPEDVLKAAAAEGMRPIIHYRHEIQQRHSVRADSISPTLKEGESTHVQVPQA